MVTLLDKLQYETELLPGGLSVYISGDHRFGTDAFLLSHFAAPKRREQACDLGSGCGIIPLLMLGSASPPQKVWGLEIQPEAVELMEMSVRENALEGRMMPTLGDLRSPPSEILGHMHLVTCNPPYFVPGHGFESPNESRRLARHEQGCTLEEICGSVAKILRYGGRFVLCHRPERLCDLMCALRGARLEPKRLRFVHQRQGSAPWLVLCEARLGGAPSVVIEPPLVMEHPDGGFSDEVLTIYQKPHRITPPEKENTHDNPHN